MRKMSRVTAAGTAMSEATLCAAHFTGEHIQRADKAADAASDADPKRRWMDTSENPEVCCGVCGAS